MVLNGEIKSSGYGIALFAVTVFLAWDNWDNGTVPVLNDFQLSQSIFMLWDTWDRLTNYAVLSHMSQWVFRAWDSV